MHLLLQARNQCEYVISVLRTSHQAQLRYIPLILFTTISKKVVGENGERRMSNGGCRTERNCGYAIGNAKFHKLRSPCVKMNTPTVNVCLRVLDSERQKKLTLFLIKRRSSSPRMNGLLSPTLHHQSQQI